jgi:hypothetical protein
MIITEEALLEVAAKVLEYPKHRKWKKTVSGWSGGYSGSPSSSKHAISNLSFALKLCHDFQKLNDSEFCMITLDNSLSVYQFSSSYEDIFQASFEDKPW